MTELYCRAICINPRRRVNIRRSSLYTAVAGRPAPATPMVTGGVIWRSRATSCSRSATGCRSRGRRPIRRPCRTCARPCNLFAGEAIKVDPERIGMMGDSAGAHLVALTSLTYEDAPFINAYPKDAFASVSARVKAVVGFYGVYDLAQQWSHDQLHRPHDNITEKFLGAPLTENRKIYLEASPITYVVKAKNATSFL